VHCEHEKCEMRCAPAASLDIRHICMNGQYPIPEFCNCRIQCLLVPPVISTVLPASLILGLLVGEVCAKTTPQGSPLF
jgi:hypothetical protein